MPANSTDSRGTVTWVTSRLVIAVMLPGVSALSHGELLYTKTKMHLPQSLLSPLVPAFLCDTFKPNSSKSK